jgi:GDP-4-dehydro-6-deoxy-D-mannose reductase
MLITGITGFVGSHFADFALARGAQIIGAFRWRSKTENIEHIRDRIELIDCDLRDLSSAQYLVEAARPDWVIHLAAQSFVGTSWQAPAETFTTNTVSQVNLLEAVHARCPKARFLVVGSSEEYGFVQDDELPITEENPLRPLSPYAVSKVAQDLLGYQYWMSWKLDCVRTRGFNHEGPRRGPVFVASDFAKQIADIEKGRRPAILNVGNLEAKRDFTDVRDIVKGYWLALEKGEPGEVYNLCRGRAWSIREVLDLLLGMTKVKVEVRQDPARLRPSDVPILLGDNAKFTKLTGWTPTIPFEQTLRDMLEYWRAR